MTEPTDIRTFRAASMREALRLVRQEMGGDAVILHTKQIDPKPGLLRKAGPPQVEITAGLGVAVRAQNPPRDRIEPAPALSRFVEQDFAATPSRTSTPAPTPRHEIDDDGLSARRREAALPAEWIPRLEAIERTLSRLSRQAFASGAADDFGAVCERLEALGLPTGVTQEWIERLQDELPHESASDPVRQTQWIDQRCRQLFDSVARIRLLPESRSVVALVGPTGVGKTTTLAKLAANFRLHEQLRMALITVDTYRIAAVEQLRTYARIIDLPMQVVTTPEEMRAAADAFSDRDLILVDTAGRSPRDAVQMAELKRLLEQAPITEVHLCLSVTASSENLVQAARHFGPVGVTSLLLTKLDEVGRLGHVLPLLDQTPLPLSYLTTGQNVPADIEAAHPDALMTRLLAPLSAGTHEADLLQTAVAESDAAQDAHFGGAA